MSPMIGKSKSFAQASSQKPCHDEVVRSATYVPEVDLEDAYPGTGTGTCHCRHLDLGEYIEGSKCQYHLNGKVKHITRKR